MRLETKTRRFIVCPRCGDDSIRVCHLEPGRTFGPWHCHGADCSAVFSGRIAEDGSVDAEMRDEPKTRGYALLRFRDLLLVVDEKYGRVENPDFFYHSHQCPVSLLGRVEAVFDAEGGDPHGVLRYVAGIDASEHVDKTIEDGCSLQELLALFKTDGQPAPTEWPEKNRGMLNWIAEMQREYASKGQA